MNAASEIPSGLTLARYLSLSGWRHVDAEWLRSPADGGVVDVYVPTDPEAPRWRARIAVALEAVAEHDGRSVSDVLEAIARIDRDIFDLVVDENELVRSVDLDVAVTTLRGFLTAAKWAAAQASAVKSEQRAHRAQQNPGPRAVFRGQPPGDASEYAGSLQFEHTIRGSFAVRISSPLAVAPVGADPPQTALMIEEEPFARTANVTLVRALQRLKRVEAAVDTDAVPLGEDAAPLPGAEVMIREGLSVNFCDAVRGLIEQAAAEDSHLLVRVDWSPKVTIPKSLGLPAGRDVPLALSGRTLEAVELVERELRSYAARRETDTRSVIGSVIGVERASPREPGRAVILGRVTRGSSKPSRLELNGLSPNQYELVLEAHRSGFAVRATGPIEPRDGSFPSVQNPDVVALPEIPWVDAQTADPDEFPPPAPLI